MSNVPTATPPGARPPLPPLAVLILGVLATSTSAVLIRLAQTDAPSSVIAAGRLALATMIIAPWAAMRRRGELEQLSSAGWRAGMLSGFMLGLHFAAYISSLEFTSIAAATVLATSTPIWVGLAAPVMLGERITRALKIGIPLAVIGSAIIGLDTEGGGSNPLLGNTLALSSALTGAVYFLIGRRLRPRLSLLSYTSIVYGCAAITLVVLALLAGHSLWGYSTTSLLLILLMAIFPQLLGHSSYNYALAFLPAAYVSIAIISEPIGASLLGLLVFGEAPGILTVGGGVMILAGIFIGGRRA